MSNAVPQAEAIARDPAELEGSSSHNDLLDELRNQNPGLAIEDAFVVPSWFVQQTAWLKTPETSDSVVYNYPLFFTIRGPIDRDALRRSLEEIVRRHQVLRSVFRLRDAALVQIVVSPEKQIFPLIDLAELPDADKEGRLRQLCFKETRQPFDLARGPLLRSTLVRVGLEHHLLQLTTHYLVYDDWSSGVLTRELTDLYQSLAAGIAPPLDYLPFQYADYVRWLEKQLRENTSRFAYWKGQLASASGYHHLSPDFARPVKSTNHGGRESVVLPLELAESLKLLSRKERVSLFMVLLAGFQALLHRHSNDGEIGVASCAANRPLPQVEGLIGRFGNDIFLGMSFADDPSFRELLGRMREVALNAYSDQSLPFGQILKETAAGSSLPFQVMFILQNANREHREVPGLCLEPFPFYSGTAKYDLTVLLKVEPALEVTLEYKTDLFRATTMKQLLDDYRAVLQQMAKDPTARISSFVLSRHAKTPKGDHGSAAVIEDVFVGKTVVAPESETESRLQPLWSGVFEKAVGLDQDFFELGGDSLLATRLFTKIEKAFCLKLPVSVLLEASTVRQLAGIISGQPARQPGFSMVPIQPLGTKPPLFCVHGHLGEVFYGRNLSHALGPEQPLFGFRSQGLGGESPFYTVGEMATCYLKEIRAVQPAGPYYLSGWCFGGMVAYEMARLLKKKGEQVALLLLFNTPAPGSLHGWPLTRGYLIRRVAHELKKLDNLGTRQKLTVFRTKTFGLARLTSGTVKTTFYRCLAKGYAARKVKRSLSVADINVAAAKTYHPEVYPGRITMFLTDEARSVYGTDPARGWSPFARDGIELHSASGDNHSLFRTPHVTALAEKLQSCLASARPD